MHHHHIIHYLIDCTYFKYLLEDRLFTVTKKNTHSLQFLLFLTRVTEVYWIPDIIRCILWFLKANSFEHLGCNGSFDDMRTFHCIKKDILGNTFVFSGKCVIQSGPTYYMTFHLQPQGALSTRWMTDELGEEETSIRPLQLQKLPPVIMWALIEIAGVI